MPRSGLTIILDMDDILTQTNRAWVESYNADWDDSLTIEDIRGWNAHVWVKPECGKSYYDYLSRPGFYFDMLPVDGALEGARRLVEQHDVVVATAAPVSSPTAVEEKKEWLRAHMPWFKLSNFLVCHRKELIRADLLFDDGAHNLKDYPSVSVCLNRPWNRGEECADVYVDGWPDFMEMMRRFGTDGGFRQQCFRLGAQRLKRGVIDRLGDIKDGWRHELG